MDDDIYTDEEKEILGLSGDENQDDLERDPDDPGQDTDDGGEGGDDKDDDLQAGDGEGETEQAEGQGGDHDLAKARLEGKYIVYEDGEKIPVDRFERLYWQQKEQERKIDLLKAGDLDAYYKAYPDEAPEGYQAGKGGQGDQGNEGEILDPIEALRQTVVPTGEYEGWTIQQVFDVDQIAGNVILQSLIDYRREESEKLVAAQEAEKAAQAKYQADAAEEATKLSTDLALEMFGVKDLAGLKPDQAKKVDAEVTRTIEWMQKDTRRLNFSVSEAYYLMERDNHLKQARSQGAKDTLDSITRPTVPSIKVGSGTPPATDAFDDMDDDTLAAHIDAMSERQYENFLRNGSSTLRQRLPDLPWA